MPQSTMTHRDREIVPARLAIRAMRDSGYRNTAYALAELIDNSVQAEATSVRVFGVEEEVKVQTRWRRRLVQIGVMDDGTGMTPEVQHLALQFGNGTHLNDRQGIGRFGMGLPNSSISQCRRVEVWTWQSGPANALYTYLDLDEIEGRSLSVVPHPRPSPVPMEWQDRTDSLGTTGTLVVWSKLEHHRLSWRGAGATLRHTAHLVGRIYRKYLDAGTVTIRLTNVLGSQVTSTELVRPNDPLYLMQQSQTPAPFSASPMFQRWGAGDEEFVINYAGAEHRVIVRMSWARPETVPEGRGDRGREQYGKHAAKNLGVSVLRGDRELELDAAWANVYDPVHRWWGIEVEFPPALDEIFGVINNKQTATVLAQLAKFDIEEEKEGHESTTDFLDRLKEENDPRFLLIPIAEHIRTQIKLIEKKLQDQTKGRRSKTSRYEEPGVADRASKKFKQRAAEGHETEFDRKSFGESERDSLADNLHRDKSYPEDVARQIADAALKRGRRVEIVTQAMDSFAFFRVEHQQGGITLVVLNTNHPFYEKLIATLHPNVGEESDLELLERIGAASDTLELLLAAWARYEMEELHKKEVLFEMRQEWGKMARFFLTED